MSEGIQRAYRFAVRPQSVSHLLGHPQLMCMKPAGLLMTSTRTARHNRPEYGHGNGDCVLGYLRPNRRRLKIGNSIQFNALALPQRLLFEGIFAKGIFESRLG